MKITNYVLLAWLLLISAADVSAKITLPAIFADEMVLQRNADVLLWGKSQSNAKIKVSTSWNHKTYHARSNAAGEWRLYIQTPQAGGPYSIDLSDGEKITLKNILIGEVWLCSGQSNMEMPVKGFRGQPVIDSQSTILAANPKRPLRLFTVKRAFSTTLQDTLTGSWQQNDPQSVGDFSATAYFFGDLLQRLLDVPVGLIHASWSASKIEAWMDRKTLSGFPEIQLPDSSQTQFGWPAGTPTLLYNAMIHPLINTKIRGVIWYQGESNSEQPDLYSKLFPAWISQWRHAFNNNDMPVYYVQIAPYQAEGKNEITRAIFRESQLRSMKEIPNVGMAITTDAGSETFIHSPHKKRIGERLALWALAKTYQIPGISYCGPLYRSFQQKGSKIEITFEHGEMGMTPENEEVQGFEIAGEDGLFYPAKARIINGSSRIEVWLETVPLPVEIRYCFRNYKEGNLCNNVGLPAAPFRIHLK